MSEHQPERVCRGCGTPLSVEGACSPSCQRDIDSGERVATVAFSSMPLTDDEAAKLADALSLADSVEDALLAAEAAARSGGDVELAEVLARVHMLWAIGGNGIRYARALLDRARDSVLEALTEDSPLEKETL